MLSFKDFDPFNKNAAAGKALKDVDLFNKNSGVAKWWSSLPEDDKKALRVAGAIILIAGTLYFCGPLVMASWEGTVSVGASETGGVVLVGATTKVGGTSQQPRPPVSPASSHTPGSVHAPLRAGPSNVANNGSASDRDINLTVTWPRDLPEELGIVVARHDQGKPSNFFPKRPYKIEQVTIVSTKPSFTVKTDDGCNVSISKTGIDMSREVGGIAFSWEINVDQRETRARFGPYGYGSKLAEDGLRVRSVFDVLQLSIQLIL